MKTINDLDKALGKSLEDFSNEMQTQVSSFEGKYLTKYDMDNIARFTFYLVDDFKKHIIDYLKENQK